MHLKSLERRYTNCVLKRAITRRIKFGLTVSFRAHFSVAGPDVRIEIACQRGSVAGQSADGSVAAASAAAIYEARSEIRAIKKMAHFVRSLRAVKFAPIELAVLRDHQDDRRVRRERGRKHRRYAILNVTTYELYHSKVTAELQVIIK